MVINAIFMLEHIKSTSFVKQAYYKCLLLEVVISNFEPQLFSCQAGFTLSRASRLRKYLKHSFSRF